MYPNLEGCGVAKFATRAEERILRSKILLNRMLNTVMKKKIAEFENSVDQRVRNYLGFCQLK